MADHPLDTAPAPETLDDYIARHSDWLYQQADHLVSFFHQERNIKTKSGNTGGLLGVRVKRNQRGPGITIEWFHYHYYGPKGARKALSRSIARGKDAQYSQNRVFTSATQEWEKSLFQQLEPDMALLRQESRALGELSRRAKGLSKQHELTRQRLANA